MHSKRSLLFITALTLVHPLLFAHHSTVAYAQKSIVLKNATITKVVWADPHVVLTFAVKDSHGAVSNWSAETGSPVSVARVGWNRNSLKAGDAVTIELFPAKNGAPVGRLKKVVLSDGRELLDTQTNPQNLK